MTGQLNPLTAQPLSVGRLYAGTSYTSYISIIYYVGPRTNYIHLPSRGKRRGTIKLP